MADIIKIGSLDISAFKVGSDDCKVYLGDTLLYPTEPPVFQGKWLATYSDSHTESAECGSSSEIAYREINLTNLVSVEIGDCVDTIGDRAFYNCTGLTSIVIPDSVMSIGQTAFASCRSLTSIDLPSDVMSIRDSAFFYCRSLTSITVNATAPPALGGQVFDNTNNCPILVPASSVNTYKSASGWSSYASRIQAIPNS